LGAITRSPKVLNSYLATKELPAAKPYYKYYLQNNSGNFTDRNVLVRFDIQLNPCGIVLIDIISVVLKLGTESKQEDF
jgi:hypothetical protein